MLKKMKKMKYNYIYDLGWEANLNEVLGASKYTWLLPVALPSGDGINYRVSSKPELEKLEEHV